MCQTQVVIMIAPTDIDIFVTLNHFFITAAAFDVVAVIVIGLYDARITVSIATIINGDVRVAAVRRCFRHCIIVIEKEKNESVKNQEVGSELRNADLSFVCRAASSNEPITTGGQTNKLTVTTKTTLCGRRQRKYHGEHTGRPCIMSKVLSDIFILSFLRHDSDNCYISIPIFKNMLDCSD